MLTLPSRCGGGVGRRVHLPPVISPPPLALKQSFLYLKQREYILYTIYSIYPVKLFISTSLPGGGGGVVGFINPPLSQEEEGLGCLSIPLSPRRGGVGVFIPLLIKPLI